MKRISDKQKARTQRLKEIACEFLEEQKGLCSDCKHPPDFRGLTLHHKSFRSQGGTDSKENLELICYRCNAKPSRHNLYEVYSDSKHGIVDK